SPSVISVRSVVEIFTTEATETTEHKMQRRAAHPSYGVPDGTVLRLRLRRAARNEESTLMLNQRMARFFAAFGTSE
ncbi:MAG: hypothetical protein ACRD06_02015, partial [Terriglobia bacterium]